MSKYIILFSLLCFNLNLFAQAQQTFSERPIFINGQDGYTCFRIPAIILAPNGDLLAFAEGKEVLLFSNPANKKSRHGMRVRVSFDEGQTWAKSRLIREGVSAYSDLVIQADKHIGLLYEHGNNGGIHYAHFNYAWLVGDNK